jgi:hypothetical protein
MAEKNSNDTFKSGLIMALIGGLFVLFSVLTAYVLNRLSTHEDILRAYEGRISKLEACVDCSKSARNINKGGYVWTEYPSDETDKGGNVTLSVEVDVLEKRYRWACGLSTKDDIVKENQNEKVSLDEIIKKYEPDEELKDAKKIIVIGTASSEGDTSSQEDLARKRAKTLVSVVEDNLQKNIPVIGMSFGQYVADTEKAKCSDATSEQRRILIVKVTQQPANMSNEELEKSLIRRFKQLVDEEKYKFPVDIRDYSNYKQGKEMFLE